MTGDMAQQPKEVSALSEYQGSVQGTLMEGTPASVTEVLVPSSGQCRYHYT